MLLKMQDFFDCFIFFKIVLKYCLILRILLMIFFNVIYILRTTIQHSCRNKIQLILIFYYYYYSYLCYFIFLFIKLNNFINIFKKFDFWPNTSINILILKKNNLKNIILRNDIS